jgi:ribosomal protein L3
MSLGLIGKKLGMTKVYTTPKAMQWQSPSSMSAATPFFR